MALGTHPACQDRCSGPSEGTETGGVPTHPSQAGSELGGRRPCWDCLPLLEAKGDRWCRTQRAVVLR